MSSNWFYQPENSENPELGALAEGVRTVWFKGEELWRDADLTVNSPKNSPPGRRSSLTFCPEDGQVLGRKVLTQHKEDGFNTWSR